MVTVESDVDLVRRWRAGEQDAWGGVFRRHYTSLHRYASRVAGPCDAADVVQDTIVRASARIGQLRDPASIRPWLFAIVRTEARGRARRTSARPQAPEAMVTIAAVEPGPEERVIGDLQRIGAHDTVWAAADGLESRDRRLLELLLRDGMSGRELAEALDVDVEQLHVMTWRMRGRLRGSIVALDAARRGAGRCGELMRIASPLDGFGPLMRKRIERHLARCTACGKIDRHDRATSTMTPWPAQRSSAGPANGTSSVARSIGSLAARSS